MTDAYIAPTNKHEIRPTDQEGLRINKPGMDYACGHEPQILVSGRVESLREYFRDERDRELGRWRSQSDSSWTAVVNKSESEVYFRNDDGLREFIVHLETRTYGQWVEELREIAKEYLAAHPEKKPWYDAKPGEVWVLTYGGQETAHVFTDRYADFQDKDPGYVFVSDRAIVNSTDPDITEGNKIWGESQ